MHELKSHPRLYAKPTDLNRLHDIPETPVFQSTWAQLQDVAAEALEREPLKYDDAGHNSLLMRARWMQERVVSLAALWWKTQEERYRQAVLDCVREMGCWEYWSWIARRQGDTDPLVIFDLSYGENSATLAIAYDWLHESLSEEERALFTEIARRRSLQPFLNNTREDRCGFFFRRADSNWNSVCTGGAGMLALAMYEELPEAAEVLKRVETSLVPYMEHLKETGGGWPEGLGYWNYGMRYAFMYFLSWENAHGQNHPLLAIPEVRRTLHFPLDFSPNGQPCSFGDAGSWGPLPFHYAMAQRYSEAELVGQLDVALDKRIQAGRRRTAWPDAAEFLVFHPRQAATSTASRSRIVELYEGQDWGVLADKWPNPNLYAAVRGGTTKVPHSNRDLLSFHCVVGDEKMIENFGPMEYLDTTFSPRREEIFEITPASKNTLLINGVGITIGSSVQTSIQTYGNIRGIRMDATEAMGEMHDGPAALFCGRVFLLWGDEALLIVDHVAVPQPARIEARFFTRQDFEKTENAATLRGERHGLRVNFSASKAALLQTAVPPLTSPISPTYNLLRWSTRDVTPGGITFATLLTPGNSDEAIKVAVNEAVIQGQDALVVNVRRGDVSQEISFSSRLLPLLDTPSGGGAV